ncbi:MAG: trypsin-like peptidase domain-containing protein [Candidatus Kapabacteria bacterium]|nr:trypsin-like peptidase domain-containing protein [Candidatus Kapabacteria bacterium]
MRGVAAIRLAIIAPCWAACTVYAQQLDARKIVEKCASAVVRIETEKGVGAGFFIHPQYIVTNKHVIERGGGAESYMRKYETAYYSPNQITVHLKSGETIPVIEVNAFRDHPQIDLAVLKVRARQRTVLPIKPTVAEVGEEIVAIGHPLGSPWNATKGIVSNNSYQDLLQLNVALDPGNSGGPLINAQGQVVGVAQEIVLLAQTANFGVRSDVLKGLLDYYGIPYSTDPLFYPTPQGLEEQFRLLQKQQRALEEQSQRLEEQQKRLDSEWERLRSERMNFEREKAAFEARKRQAEEFLREYEIKSNSLNRREQELEERKRELERRERWIQEKEFTITEKLGERFSLECIGLSSYEVYGRSFLPRAAVGLSYRFGFVRDSDGEVVVADKVGLLLTRQFSLTGWQRDELSVGMAFSGLVRLALGAVVRERFGSIEGSSGGPRPPFRYVATIAIDFIPRSPWTVGMGLTATGKKGTPVEALMPYIMLGYELNFLRW